jgi:hypothetical protein
MVLYTLFLATVVNVNKELPVQSGLTLDECKAAATEALLKDSNFARCRPAQPEMPVVLLKLPTGVIVQVERQHGGYRLPSGYSIQDEAFAALALGKPSSGVHTGRHGADRPMEHGSPEVLVTK